MAEHWYDLHLPPPLDMVRIDLERPLEDQLSGAYLAAAKEMLEKLKKSMTLGMRHG